MQKPLAIGIDLGTSNCAVAVAFADNVQPIPLEQLEDAKAKVALEVLPSLLYLPLDNEVDLATIPGLAEIAP